VKKKVFIDGQAGTTGLEIAQRLASRNDLDLIAVDPAKRKDLGARLACARTADLTILCLPDEASAELAAALEQEPVRLIDASTRHRTAPGWAYGIPELKPGFREAVASARRVSNPGCYATAFVLALRPLIEAGLVPRDGAVTVNAVSGFSGGGKAMIEAYQAHDGAAPYELLHYGNYRLDLAHKHLPEMTKWAGLSRAPLFLPAVDHFYRGMLVHLPLHASLLAAWKTDARAIAACLREGYRDERFVRVKEASKENLRDGTFLDPRAVNGTNFADLYVLASDDGHANVSVCLDNLGKGASGAAVQNLNLMLGFPEETGLV
jgi:N-acetyl-gamma-glutamyl-phosphate reductase